MYPLQEFAYVSTKMARKAGGFGSYTNVDQEEILASSSGLLNYLFGRDRSKSITRETFRQLQQDLLEEIIELEFSEYDTEGSGRISESDLCRFLLKNTKIPPKKKAAMLKKGQLYINAFLVAQQLYIPIRFFSFFFSFLSCQHTNSQIK